MKKAKCPYGDHEIRLPDDIEVDDQVRCPIDFRDAIVVSLGPPLELTAISGEPDVDEEPPPSSPRKPDHDKPDHDKPSDKPNGMSNGKPGGGHH